MPEKIVTLAGIDYGICSPAMTILPSANLYNPFEIEKIRGICLGNDDIQLNGYSFMKMPICKSDVERYDVIATFFIDYLNKYLMHCPGFAALEDYSFASRNSMVYKIGENTGVLKNKLFKTNVPLRVYQPPVIKKFATGKGNAKKPEMIDSYNLKFSTDIAASFNFKHKANPLSDIVDSIWILKLLWVEMKVRYGILENLEEDEIKYVTRKLGDGHSLTEKPFINH